ncbi:hypothetical protein E1B28_013110 [Marasmius oreades]|uniref:Uncharacterized protein n=1 Tax=Marasmius oreades TaxID=181124 RepID=A0A9P7RNZ7_9AGAR|nr:uncharacterized protein E1B28_013110 [Marasmius oreades]KAG7087131.1 hypothetical protein E1B28_013110 [Marasmius oreades]
MMHTLVSTSTAFQIDLTIPSPDPSTNPSEFSTRLMLVSPPLPLDKDSTHQEDESFTSPFLLAADALTSISGSQTSFTGDVGAIPNSGYAINAEGTAGGSIHSNDGFAVPGHAAVTSGSTTPLTSPPPPTSTSIFPSTSTSTATVTAPTQSEESRPHKLNTGGLAGGIAGGVLLIVVVATFVLCILKRRNKKLEYNLVHTGPTPYFYMIPSSGSDAFYMDITERKTQMFSQREHLKRELEVYEQVSQDSNSRNEDSPDGINGSNQQDDVVQVTRRQMEVLTRRIAALEAVTMAPPDYSSHMS